MRAVALASLRGRIQTIHQLTDGLDVGDLWTLSTEPGGAFERRFEYLQRQFIPPLVAANHQALSIFKYLAEKPGAEAIFLTAAVWDELLSLRTWAMLFYNFSGLVELGFAGPLTVLINRPSLPDALFQAFNDTLSLYDRMTRIEGGNKRRFTSIQQRERFAAAIRSLKHDRWNDLELMVSLVRRLLKTLPESAQWSNELDNRFRGNASRIDMYNSRAAKVFTDEELWSAKMALQDEIEVLRQEIEPRFSLAAARSHDEFAVFDRARQNALAVIEDVLSLMDGDITRRRETFTLSDAAEEAFNVVSGGIPSKKVELDLAALKSSGLQFTGDRRKVFGMFCTLFTNSLDAWARASDMRATTPLQFRITAESLHAGAALEIRFDDTAGGIQDLSLLEASKDDHSRQNALLLNEKGRDGGTGLGLALVYHQVMVHSTSRMEAAVHLENLPPSESRSAGLRVRILMPDLSNESGSSVKAPRRIRQAN
jgi:hypothetical protein